MDTEWKVGAFTVRTTEGEITVAGWVKGPFAIDFRGHDDGYGDFAPGWTITHVATGYIVRQVACSHADAMTIADMILEVADWSFTDPVEAKALGPKVMQIKRMLTPGVDVSGMPSFPPFGKFDRPTFKSGGAA